MLNLIYDISHSGFLIHIKMSSFVREHPLTIHVHEGSIMFEVSRKKLLFIR